MMPFWSIMPFCGSFRFRRLKVRKQRRDKGKKRVVRPGDLSVSIDHSRLRRLIVDGSDSSAPPQSESEPEEAAPESPVDDVLVDDSGMQFAWDELPSDVDVEGSVSEHSHGTPSAQQLSSDSDEIESEESSDPDE